MNLTGTGRRPPPESDGVNMTEIDVCNLALGMLGHDRTITALDDGSAEAARCSLFLPRARLAVLGAHPWGFLALETPQLEGGPAPDGRRYCYERPFEALRVVGLSDRAGLPVRFDYVNGLLLADAPEACVTYTLDNDNPDDWPPKVQDAVAADLAAKLAGPMGGDASQVQLARQSAAVCLLDARAADDNETAFRGVPGNRYAEARG